MPRPLLIRSETSPYYVTSELRSQSFFPIPMEEVWNIFLERLKVEMTEHSLVLYALVLMNNRFHLLCHTPDKNLDVIMHRFLRSTSRKINLKSQIPTSLWRSRYRWSLIEDQSHFIQVYRYIYQSPVREKLSEKVEDYPYSTLGPCRFSLGEAAPGSSPLNLEWLNQIQNEESNEVLRLGLRKALFHIARRKLFLFQRLSLPDPAAWREEINKNDSLQAP
jgi:putative transposase